LVIATRVSRPAKVIREASPSPCRLLGLTFRSTLRSMVDGMGGLLIGEVAARTGVPAPTIRYYESIGLLKAPSRSSAGYRRYSDRTVSELQFIRRAQALGFALDEVGEILRLSRSGKQPCAQVLSLAHAHLATIDQRIRQLQQFREYLASEVSKWDARKTAVTSDGLCEFIAESQPESVAEPLNSRVQQTRKRERGTSRGAGAEVGS
jgi:DNA-binding transcriptional MerR regulator